MNILETVSQQCAKEGYQVVHNIRLRIGKASHVVPDALYFAFDALKKDTPAESGKLIIETIPVGGTCTSCGKDFEVTDQFAFACPHCQANTIEITQGYELEIVDMEVD